MTHTTDEGYDEALMDYEYEEEELDMENVMAWLDALDQRKAQLERDIRASAPVHTG